VQTLAHVVLERLPILWSQPHVTELRRHQSEAVARQVKLQFALWTPLLAEVNAVEVHKQQKQTNREF